MLSKEKSDHLLPQKENKIASLYPQKIMTMRNKIRNKKLNMYPFSYFGITFFFIEIIFMLFFIVLEWICRQSSLQECRSNDDWENYEWNINNQSQYSMDGYCRFRRCETSIKWNDYSSSPQTWVVYWIETASSRIIIIVSYSFL